MGATATLNVRLPEDLKKRGGKVLERNGLSVSDAVRGLYEYLQDNQSLPEFLVHSDDDSIYECRRRTAHSLVGIVSVPEGFDVRSERIEDKYGDVL